FKDFNDEFGHQRGDLCLRQIAFAIVAAARRAGDIVARYGGDEFGAILASTSRANAEAIAENARAAVDNLKILCKSGRQVTLSIGVATAHPETGGSEEALVSAADAALYRAKNNGRNRVDSNDVEV
ncbi:MAG: GGDEF domain-containing protein, partial [Thermoanaerobaculia bacterium]